MRETHATLEHMKDFFCILLLSPHQNYSGYNTDTYNRNSRILCTLQFLFISNNFCNGGERPKQGDEGSLCTWAARAGWLSSFVHLLLHPQQQYGPCNLPFGLLVHKTTYTPMLYTALCIMFWMRAYPLLGQVGGGISQGPKLSISRAQPPTTCPLMDMQASKTLCTGLYKS